MENKGYNYYKKRSELLQKNIITNKNDPGDIIDNFPKYIVRKQIGRFLAQNELFKQVLGIKGSIVECGVFHGGGLMTWAQLSSIYEPYNYHREIFGFDTFSGFPNINGKDIGKSKNSSAVIGGLCSNSYNELLDCIELFDSNRPLSDKKKVTLIKGDFIKTGEKFIQENKHLIISLMFLDFDAYEPTKKALEFFLPRMPKGAILAFDEINNPDWPGETVALLEKFNLNNYTLRQFTFEPNISYIIL